MDSRCARWSRLHTSSVFVVSQNAGSQPQIHQGPGLLRGVSCWIACITRSIQRYLTQHRTGGETLVRSEGRRECCCQPGRRLCLAAYRQLRVCGCGAEAGGG